MAPDVTCWRRSKTPSISNTVWMFWSEIWTVNLEAIYFYFFVIKSPLLPESIISLLWFRLITLDVSKPWLLSSSPFQTSSLFPRPCLPQPPPHPTCSLGSCLIPLLTSPPWYSHYIPTGYSQSLWNAGSIPGITGGWLADWLLLGIGNTLPYSSGKQLLSSFSFIYLQLSSSEKWKYKWTNEWTAEDWNGDSYFHYSFLSHQSCFSLVSLIERGDITTLLGIILFYFVLFLIWPKSSLSLSLNQL